MLLKEYRVHLDQPIELIMLILVQFQKLAIELFVDLQIVDVFEYLLVVHGIVPELLLVSTQLGLSADGAPFDIKRHVTVLPVLKDGCILHHDDVKRCKMIGLESKDSVYSR